MDHPNLSNIPIINLQPRTHKRIPSLSPTRSPTRQRITEDILADLSPATTLEAFTSSAPSGKLRASIEAATPSERAFGIRATLASKKIQEWLDELSAWPWPNESHSQGFEEPTSKRRKLDSDFRSSRAGHPESEDELAEVAYMGSLPTEDVLAYEIRIDEIEDDMEDIDVEGIKKTVLNTHFSPRSRPSSAASEVAPLPSSLLGYTKMDDFTAIVTATVLKALPNLGRLLRLMDVWSVRLGVLRKVPPLLELLHDAEIALKSGWQAIGVKTGERGEDIYLERNTFDVMRNVLQDKVTSLGQVLDFMLDTLEGREDTLPEHWLDRMEKIEADYGEWVVSADRKVREGEWAKMAKRRKEEEERRKAEEAAREAARLEAERLQKEEEDRLRAEEAAKDAARLEAERLRKEEDDRLREEEATKAAALLAAERVQKEEQERLAAEEAARLEAERLQKTETRMQAERNAALLETARLQKEHDDLLRLELEQESASLEAERLRNIEEQRLQRIEEDRLQKLEAARLRAVQEQEEDARSKAGELQKAEQERLRIEEEELEAARITVARIKREEEERLKANDDALESARLEAERVEQEEQAADRLRATKATVDAVKLKAQEMKADDAKRLTESAQVIEAGGLAAETIKSVESHDLDMRRRASIESHNTRIRQDHVEAEHGSGLERNELVNEVLHEAGAKDLSPTAESDSATEILSQSSLQEVDVHDNLVKADDECGRSDNHNQQLNRPAPEARIKSNDSNVEETSLTLSEVEGFPVEHPALDGNNESRIKHAQFGEAEHIPLRSVKGPLDGSEITPPLRVLSPRPVVSITTPAVTPISNKLRHRSQSPSAPNPWSDQPAHSSILPRESISTSESPDSNATSRSQSVATSASSLQISQVGGRLEPHPKLLPSPIPIPLVDGAVSTYSDDDLPPPTRSSQDSLKGDEGSHFNGDGAQESRVKIIEAIESQDVRPAIPDRTSSITNLVSDTLREGSHLHGDGAQESRVKMMEAIEAQDVTPAILDRTTSIANLDSDTLREGTNDSSFYTSSEVDTTSSAIPLSPVLAANITEPFPDIDDQSPLLGRVGLRRQLLTDQNPPPLKTLAFDRDSVQLQNAPELDQSPSLTPITPTFDQTPDFPSLDTSPTTAPVAGPRKALTSDDQFHSQISSLLEGIPAHIRLTTQSDVDGRPSSPFLSSQDDTLRPKKVRKSLTPSVRSSSSMSMRAPTPSFTLAPAYSKPGPRQRHQNGNPEIKLYHLSRSTGEAPIKLFVRLVGENGERVMVRVGGGWADLGEYLREYASHHGRRVVSGASEDDKVEIQDLPSRVVSNSSTNSYATVRPTGNNNGRSSPVPRPHSVLERERPMSSLYIRKTRKSVGEQSESSTSTMSFTPSTPNPASPPRVNYDTPPSGAARSVSRMSWTNDDGGLGLAGPKTKAKAISERDQEWVESMKEKVRLASAEKEKQQQRKDGGRRSFGELEKVGGTKRLFKKSS